MKKLTFVNFRDEDYSDYMGVEHDPMICRLKDEMMGLLSYDVDIVIDHVDKEYRLTFYFHALNKQNHDYDFIYVGESFRSSRQSIIEYAESIYNWKGGFHFEVFQANRFEIETI